MVHEQDNYIDEADLDGDGKLLGREEYQRLEELRQQAAEHRREEYEQRIRESIGAWSDERPSVELLLPDSGTTVVSFEYSQPNISVSKSIRYAEHKVIGGTTVRQRLGEDLPEITIEGVCTVSEANSIDRMSGMRTVEVVSNRWEGEAEVASTSTRPITDGGARDYDRNWLHRFTIELIGATETSQTDLPEDAETGGGGDTGPARGPGFLSQH